MTWRLLGKDSNKTLSINNGLFIISLVQHVILDWRLVSPIYPFLGQWSMVGVAFLFVFLFLCFFVSSLNDQEPILTIYLSFSFSLIFKFYYHCYFYCYFYYYYYQYKMISLVYIYHIILLYYIILRHVAILH